MEYNIYLVCEPMKNAENVMMTLCCFLKDKLPLENLHLCYLHIGSIDSWNDTEVDLDVWREKFTSMFLSQKFPRVTTFHMEGYESAEGAADMCYSVMKGAKGPSAVLVDLEQRASVMVLVSDRLGARIAEDKMDSSLIFCTQSEVIEECCKNGYEKCKFLKDYSDVCAPYRVGLRERFLRSLHLDGVVFQGGDYSCGREQGDA